MFSLDGSARKDLKQADGQRRCVALAWGRILESCRTQRAVLAFVLFRAMFKISEFASAQCFLDVDEIRSDLIIVFRLV